MSSNELKESLKKLHAGLNSTDQVDAELAELLQVLGQDIQHLLTKEQHDEDVLSGLGERTQALSARFAAQNPHLESALRELGAILERMGI